MLIEEEVGGWPFSADRDWLLYSDEYGQIKFGNTLRPG
jgi:hypothetical protein